MPDEKVDGRRSVEIAWGVKNPECSLDVRCMHHLEADLPGTLFSGIWPDVHGLTCPYGSACV